MKIITSYKEQRDTEYLYHIEDNLENVISKLDKDNYSVYRDLSLVLHDLKMRDFLNGK